MTKEEIVIGLKQRYTEKYLEYCGLRKQKIHPFNDSKKNMQDMMTNNSFAWKSGWTLEGNQSGNDSSEEEKERRIFVVETITQLACEAMPEAYMEARRHEQFRVKHSDLCPEITKNLFPPFGGICYYKKYIADRVGDYIKKHQKDSNRYEKGFERTMLEFANDYARDEWRRNRESVFCGETGVYEEEQTWKHIQENIIPFATLDIWESLYEFYNGKEACVPTEDRQKFNELYQIYLDEHPDYYDLMMGTTKKPKAKEKATDIDIIREYSECHDKAVFEKALKSQKKNVTFKDLVIAYYARRFLDLSDDSVKASIMARFENATEKDCRRLMDALRMAGDSIGTNQIPDEWIIIRQVLDKFNKLPETWESIVVDQFNNSMRNSPNLVGWWISFLYDNNLFYTHLGYNRDFWESISEENVSNTIAIIRKCVADNSVMYNLYRYVAENRDVIENGSTLLRLLQRECIEHTYEIPNYSKALNSLSTSMECFCLSPDDWKKFSDEINSITTEHEKNEEDEDTAEHNTADRILSLDAMTVPIEKLSEYIANLDEYSGLGERTVSELNYLMTKVNDSIKYFKDFWANKNI